MDRIWNIRFRFSAVQPIYYGIRLFVIPINIVRGTPKTLNNEAQATIIRLGNFIIVCGPSLIALLSLDGLYAPKKIPRVVKGGRKSGYRESEICDARTFCFSVLEEQFQFPCCYQEFNEVDGQIGMDKSPLRLLINTANSEFMICCLFANEKMHTFKHMSCLLFVLHRY